MELNTKDTISLKKTNNIFLTDVETCNDQRIIMELSCLVVNNKLGISESHCFIIQQVWEDPEYRQGKYAKEKLDKWQQMLDSGQAELISIYHLYNKLNRIIKDKKIRLFSAYNANFDFKAIENTYHRYGIDKKPDYKETNLIAKLDKFCLWRYAKKQYCTKDYIKWAKKHSKFTPTFKIKSSAETLYQYITEQQNFVETHIGIEDLQIEYTILVSSMLANTLDRNNMIELNKNGSWREVENTRQELETTGKA